MNAEMYWDSHIGTSSSAPRISSRSPPAPTRLPPPPPVPQDVYQSQLQTPPESPQEDSSGLSEEEESGYNDVVRQGEQMNVQEIDAESIIAPVISRTQSTALYRNARAPSSPTGEFLEDDNGPRSLDRIVEGAQKRSRTYGGTSNRYPDIITTPPQPGKVQGQPKKSRAFFQVPSIQMPNVSLPSLPNVTLPSFSGVKNTRLRSKTLFNPRPRGGINSSFFTDRATAFFSRPETNSGVRPGGLDDFGRPGSRPPPRPPTHRRSSSTPSIRPNTTHVPNDPLRASLSRTISTTSSLGDDTKFMHIHSPANARIKAIRDNFLGGLPNFPQLAQLNPFNDSVPETSQNNTTISPALEALDNVTGDIVVMGGYRGSILRDKTAGNRRVWVPLKVGLNLRKVDLEVGLDPEDEESMKDKIVEGGMLTHIGPVDISKKLLKRLRSGADQHGRKVHEWGYDWRLSPELLSKRLIEFLETLECNFGQLEGKRKGKGALVIAHSLGGLITRHAMNQRPELFSGVIFAGTPQTCVNILGPLRNGDAVMLNSKVFTAQVNFTLRTSYAFLPEDGECFVDRTTGKPIPLDFFNVETWKEYCLSPCVSTFAPYPAPSASTSVLGNFSDSAMLRPFSYSDRREAASTSDLTKDRTLAPQIASSSTMADQQHCTLPLSKTIPYLTRTLSETLRFRKALEYDSAKKSLYPPQTVLYSKTSPTVRGARVDGVEGIKRADAYVDLLFGAGDGVCLAKKAMLPPGYKCTRRVAVDRGHISLLGDLEGVGRCVEGIIAERGW